MKKILEVVRGAVKDAIKASAGKPVNPDTLLSDIEMGDNDLNNITAWVNRADVVSNIERDLGITIPDKDFFKFNTVNDILLAAKGLLDCRESELVAAGE